MSVVVCKINKDNIEVAADSICVKGWSKIPTSTTRHVKLMKCNDIIIGGCGLAEETSLFFHYLKTHLIDEAATESDILDFITEFKKWKGNYTSPTFENSYIIAYKGKAFLIDGLFVTEIFDSCAIGAGQDYANGALYMGATAKEAVEAACSLCAMVAEPIIIEKIPKENKKDE